MGDKLRFAVLAGVLCGLVCAAPGRGWAQTDSFSDELDAIEKKATGAKRERPVKSKAPRKTRAKTAQEKPPALPDGPRYKEEPAAGGTALQGRGSMYDRELMLRPPAPGDAKDPSCSPPKSEGIDDARAVAIKKEPQASYDHLAALLMICDNEEKKAQYLGGFDCDPKDPEFKRCKRYKEIAQECDDFFVKETVLLEIDFADRVKKYNRCAAAPARAKTPRK